MPKANGNADFPAGFMRSLFRACKKSDGFVNLRFISPKGPVRNDWIPVNEMADRLPSFISSNKEKNCYFAVALRQNKRGDKGGITRIPALWCDVDSKNLDEQKKREFAERFKKFPLKPSFVLKSGRGVHLYWRLHTPVFSKEIPKIENLNRRLAAHFLADPAACEAARVMRIPGTRNLKYPSKPKVEISREFSDGRRAYNLEDLDQLIPSLESHPPKKTKAELEPEKEKFLLEGVNEGERNSALTKIAGRMIGRNLSKQEVISIARTRNEKNNPPLPDNEVICTIDSIWKKHFSRDNGDGEEDTSSNLDLKLSTLRDVFNYPEPSFIIDRILPEGTVSALGAYIGTGKSLVALSIIKAILTGKSLWGHFRVKRRGPVLLIDEETPRPFLKERIEKMSFDEDLPLRLLHFQDVRLDVAGCLEKIKEFVEEIKPVLVVIDSLIRVHRKKEDDAAEMSRVMDALRKIANWGTTVLIIHHHRKGEGPIHQRLRGSSDIPGGIDLEFSLIRKDGCLIFSPVKTRTKPFQPIRLKLEANDGKIDFLYEGAQPRKTDQILEAVISSLPQRGEMSIPEIAISLKRRGIKVGGKKLRSILSDASGKQLIEKPGARGKKLYRVNPGWQFGNPRKKGKLPRSKGRIQK